MFIRHLGSSSASHPLISSACVLFVTFPTEVWGSCLYIYSFHSFVRCPISSVCSLSFKCILVSWWLQKVYLFIYFFFGHLSIWGVPGPGVRSEAHLWPTLQLWQHGILQPTVLGRGSNLCPSAPGMLQSCWATGGISKRLNSYVVKCINFFFFLVFLLWLSGLRLQLVSMRTWVRSWPCSVG